MLNKNDFNFTFIGAGSTMFTLNLVSDILHESDFIHSGELRLVDIDAKALEDVYGAVCKMIAHTGRNFKVSKHMDFNEALPGVDFLFLTYVTGGFSSWKQDIDICTKHGVLQSVGDTIGPGGIIRTIRNVPIAYEIAKAMEKIAPDAWIINYSNPEGSICLAIEKYTGIRTFGLCHGTPDTVKELARHVYQVPEDKLKFRAAGVNHLTWITQLEIDGKDVYPELAEKLVETGYDKQEPISAELLNIYGLYPAPGDRHVGEFFPFYLKERVLAEKGYAWKNADMAQLSEWRKKALEKVRQLNEGTISWDDVGHSGETATHFMRALAKGVPTLEMANVINKGYIENISDGIIVEVPVFVDGFGLHPQKIGRMPPGIAAKCEALGREYELAVDAAIHCDRAFALQAMMLDPLVANCDYPDKLLDELIMSYIGQLPKGWKKYYKCLL